MFLFYYRNKCQVALFIISKELPLNLTVIISRVKDVGKENKTFLLKCLSPAANIYECVSLTMEHMVIVCESYCGTYGESV